MRVILAALILCASSVVWAQTPVCLPRATLIERLADKYQEAPVAVGITHSGALIEVLASRDGATWTLLVTSADGMSCAAATGTNWQERRAPPDPGA